MAEVLAKGQVIEETPDGPMLVVEVVNPLGKTYAVLTPWSPVWVEVQGDQVLPVPERDIPLLGTLVQQGE